MTTYRRELFKIQILKFKFEQMFSIIEVLQMLLEGKLDFLHRTKKMHEECTGQGREWTLEEQQHA